MKKYRLPCHCMMMFSRGKELSRLGCQAFYINSEFLLQEIHMCNMKELSLFARKFWPKSSVLFFKCMSKVKVKFIQSIILIPTERSFQKEYTKYLCYMKAHFCIQQLWLVFFFESMSLVKVIVMGSKVLVPTKMYYHKEDTCLRKHIRAT